MYMEKQLIIVILAGGEGKRMECNKKSHALLEKVGYVPIIARVVNEAAKLFPRKLFIVVNQNELKIAEALREYAITRDYEFINQGPSNGTGYALQVCRNRLKKYNNANTLIIPGNIPLIKMKLLEQIVQCNSLVNIPYIEKDDPNDDTRLKIVKQCFNKLILRRDCCAKDLNIKTVSIGIYLIDNITLCSNIQFVQTCLFETEEYFIEDIFPLIKKENKGEIKLIKFPLLNHIYLRQVVDQKSLKEVNDYVSALELIK